MTTSKTLSRSTREPPAQQTFAFWQAEEDTPVAKATHAPAVRVSPQPTVSVPRPRPRTTPPQEAEQLGRSKVSIVPTSRPFLERIEQGEERVKSEHRSALMADLRGRAAAIAANPAMDSAPQFSTGSRALDACLPSGGLKRGWLCEWVAGHDASGASTLAMLAAASTMTDRSQEAADSGVDESEGQGSAEQASARQNAAPPHRGPVIVVDPNGTFHAAAAIACGISPQRIVVCRPRSRRDSVWTIDQALRCSSVAAVWSALPWNFDDRDARRLQLAAEEGRTPGLFVLPSSARTRPSFAAVRWHVAAVPLNASGLSTDQRVAAGLPLRPPLDLRILCVSLDRARNFNHASSRRKARATNQSQTDTQMKTFLAVTPDARLHPLTSAVVAKLQRLSEIPTTHTPAGNRHEAVAVSLAARLADPASTHSRSGAPTQPNRRSGGASRAG